MSDDTPAWVRRMEKATDKLGHCDVATGYHCSGFEANAIAREWRDMQAEIARILEELMSEAHGHKCMTEEAERLREERDEYKAALEEKYLVNVDSDLFRGLVGGSFATGTLLATLHRVVAERNEAREAARWLYDNWTEIEIGNVSRDKWPWLVSGE